MESLWRLHSSVNPFRYLFSPTNWCSRIEYTRACSNFFFFFFLRPPPTPSFFSLKNHAWHSITFRTHGSSGRMNDERNESSLWNSRKINRHRIRSISLLFRRKKKEKEKKKKRKEKGYLSFPIFDEFRKNSTAKNNSGIGNEQDNNYYSSCFSSISCPLNEWLFFFFFFFFSLRSSGTRK